MARSNRTVVLFTRWFPYNKWKELSFLEDEIYRLEEHFDKLILVPQKIVGEKYELPPSIYADESMTSEFEQISLKEKLATVFSIYFIRELFRIGFNRKKLKYSISTFLSAVVVRNWIRKSFDKDQEIVFYSFWMDYSALGSTLASMNNKNWKTVSRCHNFDLYGNEDNQFYVPFQHLMLKKMNGVYPDSKAGEEYIHSGFVVRNCESQIMGVSAAKKLNEASGDSIFRALSCSYMIPRKRVPLILEGMIELALREAERKFIWTHIGDGEEMELVKKMLEGKPENLDVILLGSLTNEQLENYYLNNSIDVFINVSEKEGTPVSLMEAISYGIPVMASSFGGNKEVVERSNGIALSLSPTKIELAENLQAFIQVDAEESRKRAVSTWDEYYNSHRNYNVFCEKLKAV